ncbi:MAG: anti-sigma factor family protein [Sediminibacterium sp.]
MQINASTYETFFLLYIDNELSAKERLEVDAFIAENPSYALLMEELKATVIEQEAIPYAFKAQLKQLPANELMEMEELEETWNQSFKNDIAEDIQAIKGLSNDFKESLKKNKASKGVIIRPFGFNQNKLTYTAVAALMMVFFGYQQLTKSTELNTTTATVANATKPKASTNDIEIAATANQPVQSKTQVTKTSEAQIAIAPQMEMIVKESIVLNESTNAQMQLNSTNIVADIQLSSDLNTAATNTLANSPINNTNTTIDSESEIILNEKETISYEVIDTEDPNRSIYIANFEIDGNRLRGLKRKVNSLFKNNKSDRNK